MSTTATRHRQKNSTTMAREMEWSEPREPDAVNSFYDHVEAITALGPILIEWKSWKDYGSYDCVLPWNGPDGHLVCVNESSLEYAKIRVEEEFAKMAARMHATPVMRHKVRWDIQKRCRQAIFDYDKTIAEWIDFQPAERGGSPMEAYDEAMGDAEVKLLDAILDVLQDYGLEFSK